MKTNYILIDYENVQPDSIPTSGDVPTKVLIFVGSRQPKIPTTFLKSIQDLQGDAEYVWVTGEGKNALDFHIAYYIGKIAAGDPDSQFHIISKDQGYDPLIRHLKNEKIQIRRLPGFANFDKSTSAHHGTVDEKVEVVLNSLSTRKTGLPKRVKTLRNSINAFFQKSLKNQEINQIVSILQRKKVIEIDKTVVRYPSTPKAKKKAAAKKKAPANASSTK